MLVILIFFVLLPGLLHARVVLQRSVSSVLGRILSPSHHVRKLTVGSSEPTLRH